MKIRGETTKFNYNPLFLFFSNVKGSELWQTHLIHGTETPALLWHLLLYVRTAEDGLQIHPGGLHAQPLVQDLLEQHELGLPLAAKGQQRLATCGSSAADTDGSTKEVKQKYITTRILITLLW